jgi:GNAT superfamily N-acetyltransferase
MRASEFITEAFDQPYKGKWEKSDYGDADMLAKLPDGTNLSIMFNLEDDENDVWGVEFYRNNSQEVTGEGDAQRIFATVLNAIQKFIKKNKPQKLFFSASKELDPSTYYGPDDVVPNPESRAKLYDRLVLRYAKAWGYRAFRADNGKLVRYELSRLSKSITESKTVEFEGLTLKISKNGHQLMVNALDDWGNKVLGHVTFNIGDGKELDPQDLKVDDKYQGQGIAKVMYDYVKSLGYTIARSYDQTDAGAGFWNKHRGEDVRVWEGLTEARNSLFAFVKQHFPSWPDYVLKDFLYQQAKGIRNQEELDDFIKRNRNDFGKVQWRLEKLPITMNIFTPKTQRMLVSREGGSANPYQVPRDAERHSQQLKMIQQKGVSEEPIIVAKLNNGYDLIEGWHRTIQHLQVYSKGYTAPAWVGYGATYTSKSVNQGVAEENELKEDWRSALAIGAMAGAMRAKEFITEAFDQPYSFQWEVGEFGDYDAYTKLPDGSNLSIIFNNDGVDDNAYSIEFWRNNSQEATGDGDAQRVFATVLRAIQEFLTKEQPNFISFIGAKGETGEGKNSRVNLYSKLLQRYATNWGYKLKNVFDRNDSVEFDLVKIKQVKIKQDVAEGKIKLYTDPGYFGAEVDDAGFDSLPVVNISADRLVGFEPDSKMQQPKSRVNVEKIVAGLKKGDKLPPLLVRKYKNGYQVLDGHHRFWAYKLSGTKSIPVRIVADKDIEEISKSGVAEGLQNNGISFRVQKGKNKFATTMTVNNEQVGVYQYDANSGRSVAEVYPEFKGKGFGKLLVLHAIYTAAKLGLDFQEDESRTAEYDNVLDSLSSNSYIVDDDGYWYVTGGGEQYLQQSLKQGVAEGTELPGDFNLMGQNLFLKNLARNLKQRYPDATVKLSSDRVTAYHNKGDDERLSVMGTEIMDNGYIGVGLDDAFTESFKGVLVPTIKQTTEQLLAANPKMRPALFLSTDNWNPDAWTHIADKLGYRLVADDESLNEQGVTEAFDQPAAIYTLKTNKKD